MNDNLHTKAKAEFWRKFRPIPNVSCQYDLTVRIAYRPDCHPLRPRSPFLPANGNKYWENYKEYGPGRRSRKPRAV